jgi:hypothetical protein
MTYFLSDEIQEAARILSRENGDARGRRGAERMMAKSVAALWLYRLRELQCAVTTTVALRDGKVPKADLRLAWQRSRTRTFAEWKEIEESLADPVFSLEQCQDADKLRQDLLSARVAAQGRRARPGACRETGRRGDRALWHL